MCNPFLQASVITDLISYELKLGQHQKTLGTTREPKIIRGQQKTDNAEQVSLKNVLYKIINSYSHSLPI